MGQTLVNWLAEILYLSDSKNSAYWIYEVTEFSPQTIRAKFSGVKVAKGQDEIKAVTYHVIGGKAS